MINYIWRVGEEALMNEWHIHYKKNLMKIRTASILSRYQNDTSDVGGERCVRCYVLG